MSQSGSASSPDRPRPPPGPPPRPARRPGDEDEGRDEAGSPDGREYTGRTGRGPKKPTPARVLSDVAHAPGDDEPDLEERVVELGGGRWLVRVLGRARAGSTGPSAPLLLIGFWPDGSEAEVHDREALVVAHDLDSLSDDRLQTVFDEARTPPDPARPTSFFDDRRGRQRG